MVSADGQVMALTGVGLCTEVSANGNSLVADEPVGLAGLGSCTAMTVRMHADRKGWPLESVRVRMKHGKIHAKDCEECQTENGRIDWIELELELEGPLEEGQRRRLIEVAGKCPVHRTLNSEVLIEVRA